MEKFLDNIQPMDLMRSEKMSFVQLIIPAESAHRAISYLGEVGLLQFRDVSDFGSVQIRLYCFCVWIGVSSFTVWLGLFLKSSSGIFDAWMSCFTLSFSLSCLLRVN